MKCNGGEVHVDVGEMFVILNMRTGGLTSQWECVEGMRLIKEIIAPSLFISYHDNSRNRFTMYDFCAVSGRVCAISAAQWCLFKRSPHKAKLL